MLKKYLDDKNEKLKSISAIKILWLMGIDNVLDTVDQYRVIIKFKDKVSCDSFVGSHKEFEGCLIAMDDGEECSCFAYFIDFPECDSSYLKDFSYNEFYRAYVYEERLGV